MSDVLDRAGLVAEGLKLPVERVELPGGKAAFVRTMTAGELDAFEASNHVAGPDGKFRVRLDGTRGRLGCRTICDEQGKRLFGDDDAAAVGGLNHMVLDPLLDAARRLNGIGQKAQEDARGNSSPAPSGGSSSGSA